jgi:MYXO-CTERM domain-containing protein
MSQPLGRVQPRSVFIRALLGWSLLTAACSGDLALPDDQAPPAPEPAGSVRGQLMVHVLSYADGAQIKHLLQLGPGETRELRFPDPPPELASGVELRVWGEDDGATLTVRRHEVVAAPEPSVEARLQALVNGPKKPPKRWAFVLIDTGEGVALTKESATARLFSESPTSIRSYYREVSYGTQELSGDVIGPLRLTASVAGGLCENFGAAAQALAPMVTGTYDQYLWFFGSEIDGCPWGGVAQLGTAERATRHSFYNANADCVVLVQEPGHNFGMVHSSALRCTRGGQPVSMVATGDGGSCSHDEYGNPFDPMGGGGGAGSQQNLNSCFHMNGVQKSYQDWLGGCNVVKATTSGTFTVFPLERACNGTQVLQVPLPASRSLTFPPSPVATLRSGVVTAYYVEYRVPVGLDAGLRTPRVFIVAAGDLREARQRGNPNWLIDTTPETRSVLDAQLAVGKTFSDPAPNGPKITVVSADDGKAVIRVQLGATVSDTPGSGVCSNDQPFQGPGPVDCAAGGSAPPPSPATDAGNPGTSDAGVTPPPPPPGLPADAGVLPPLRPRDAGIPLDPMPMPTSPPQAVSSGCNCHVGSAARATDLGGGAGLLVLALAAFVVRRRRCQ